MLAYSRHSRTLEKERRGEKDGALERKSNTGDDLINTVPKFSKKNFQWARRSATISWWHPEWAPVAQNDWLDHHTS